SLALRSFPTRRSSDLFACDRAALTEPVAQAGRGSVATHLREECSRSARMPLVLSSTRFAVLAQREFRTYFVGRLVTQMGNTMARSEEHTSELQSPYDL